MTPPLDSMTSIGQTTPIDRSRSPSPARYRFMTGPT